MASQAGMTLMENHRGLFGHLSAASDGNTQQERDQKRTERRFARNVAQNAQGHAGLSTFVDRIAKPVNRTFHGFGDFLDGGPWLRNWIQAIV
jgi:hypothetical protein